MLTIPDDREVWAVCPVCEERIALSRMIDTINFDLSPIKHHIVAAHSELKENKHVPNVRILWRVIDQPEPRT
jgi:hypothetical protein